MIKLLIPSLIFIKDIFGLTSYEKAILRFIHRKEGSGRRVGRSDLYENFDYVSKRKIEKSLTILLKKKYLLLHDKGGYTLNKEKEVEK